MSVEIGYLFEKDRVEQLLQLSQGKKSGRLSRKGKEAISPVGPSVNKGSKVNTAQGGKPFRLFLVLFFYEVY